MTAPRVEFVITEHPPAITPARERHYEELRQRLEEFAGVAVGRRRYDDPVEFKDAAAVVLSGSFEPWSVHSPGALASLGERLGRYAGPVLGICAGMQLQVLFAGGTVAPRAQPEVGFAPVELLREDPLLEGLGPAPVVYMHHAEDVTAVPEEVVVLARSRGCAVEAIAAPDRRWWGTQFHPECFSGEHPEGARVLSNFFALAGLGERREAGSAEAARRTAGGLVAASAADAASAG
jgi:GMP synthase-like glutamine amidotransferase